MHALLTTQSMMMKYDAQTIIPPPVSLVTNLCGHLAAAAVLPTHRTAKDLLKEARSFQITLVWGLTSLFSYGGKLQMLLFGFGKPIG